MEIAAVGEVAMGEVLEPDGYRFESLPAEMKAFAAVPMRDYWLKWGLESRTCARFRIAGKRCNPDEQQAFLMDLFNSDEVRDGFKIIGAKGQPVSLVGKVSEAYYEELVCIATSMDFFEPFVKAGVVTSMPEEVEGEESNGTRTGGYIRRKMDEDVDGVMVSDLLKDTLLNPYADSPLDDVLDRDAQKELLFRIFKWIVAGGGRCQPEDSWGPYLDATKAVYRDLTTVVKDPTTSELCVASRAYAVTGLRSGSGDTMPLFPHASPHSVCFVVVDPIRRTVALLYGAFMPFW